MRKIQHHCMMLGASRRRATLISRQVCHILEILQRTQPFNFCRLLWETWFSSWTPSSPSKPFGPNSTTRTPATDTTNGRAHNNSTTNMPHRNARAQHLDMSRCWDVANFCPLVVNLLWARPLVVFVSGVRVVKFGSLTAELQAWVTDFRKIINCFYF